MRLAQHIEDVQELKPFANPLTMYRDIRYGLVRGLAARAKADALPLLIEMATTDPITLIRQQAHYAIADIQDTLQLAGREASAVTWPASKPLEAWHVPRGLKWRDTAFLELPKVGMIPSLNIPLKGQLSPKSFRNLNTPQSSGAEQMMIAQVEETRLAFAAAAQLPEEARIQALSAALDLPYPYMRYLALQGLADCGKGAVPIAMASLQKFAGRGNAPGDALSYWWCCEVLAKARAQEALPVLTKHASAVSPRGTFGPQGMALGYISARTLGYLVGDVKHTEVQRLLASDNVWLKAGILRGLAEAKAAGIGKLLQEAASADQPALVPPGGQGAVTIARFALRCRSEGEGQETFPVAEFARIQFSRRLNSGEFSYRIGHSL